jgi:hypothetical protein
MSLAWPGEIHSASAVAWTRRTSSRISPIMSAAGRVIPYRVLYAWRAASFAASASKVLGASTPSTSGRGGKFSVGVALSDMTEAYRMLRLIADMPLSEGKAFVQPAYW